MLEMRAPKSRRPASSRGLRRARTDSDWRGIAAGKIARQTDGEWPPPRPLGSGASSQRSEAGGCGRGCASWPEARAAGRCECAAAGVRRGSGQRRCGAEGGVDIQGELQRPRRRRRGPRGERRFPSPYPGTRPRPGARECAGSRSLGIISERRPFRSILLGASLPGLCLNNLHVRLFPAAQGFFQSPLAFFCRPKGARARLWAGKRSRQNLRRANKGFGRKICGGRTKALAAKSAASEQRLWPQNLRRANKNFGQRARQVRSGRSPRRRLFSGTNSLNATRGPRPGAVREGAPSVKVT